MLLRMLRTACSLLHRASRRSASVERRSNSGLSNCLLVGRITISVKGMTDPKRTPAMSHEKLTPVSHAASDDTRPTAAQAPA